MDAKVRTGGNEDAATDLEGFEHEVDEIIKRVDMIEQKVDDIEHFYASENQKEHAKGSSVAEDKERENLVLRLKWQREASEKRMNELWRQFYTILNKIIQYKWAWPFTEPVDVVGLGLHDYYEVTEKPMDFSAIKKQMDATDVPECKDIWQAQADVRLVFRNAMTYNDENHDVYKTAKCLLEKFDGLWLQLLPKVLEEEKKQKALEAEAQDMPLSQEEVYVQMSDYISKQLYKIDRHLEEVREMVIQNCRKMSTGDKKKLVAALTRLSAEDLSKAVEIVAQNDPSFKAAAEEVDLDLDAQNELTLWKLKWFVKDALEAQSRSLANMGNKNLNTNQLIRKRAICNALGKTANKKRKKL